MQQRSKRKQFAGIQALRGVAACMVVAHHATGVWSIKFARNGEWSNGATGVDLFFVISGFVMAASYAGKNSPSAGKYLAGRLIRVVPLYWIMTLIVLLKRWLIRDPQELGIGIYTTHTSTTVSDVLHSLLFIPIGMNTKPVLGQGWTLNYEMFFYLTFALSLFLGFRMARFLFPVLASCAILGLLRNHTWPGFTEILDPLLLEFLGGMAIGMMARNKIKFPVMLSAVLGVVGLVFMLTLPAPTSQGMRFIDWGLPAILVINAVVALEGRLSQVLPKFLLAVGDASYSLYLSHFFVIQAVFILYRHHSAIPNKWGVVATCLAVSVPASLVLYRLVEKPMTGLLMRTLMPVEASASSTQHFSDTGTASGDSGSGLDPLRNIGRA
jgi:exopolysaccharide production protein ExoZ